MRILRIKKYIILLLPLMLITCRDQIDINNDPGINPDFPDLIKANSLRLINVPFSADLNEQGSVSQQFLSYSTYGWPGRIFNSGIWMSGYQNGHLKGNIAAIGGRALSSNFIPEVNDAYGEVYYMNEAMLENLRSQWPENAPKNDNGEFIILGDEMCWVYLKSNFQADNNIFGHPFDSLKISQTIFAYEQGTLENTIFVKYEISNESEEDISDLFLGYYSDVDMFFGSSNGDCIGYDSLWQISYTYSKVLSSFERYYGVGNIVLRTPGGWGNEVELYAHRIIARDDSSNFGEFNMLLESLHFALQGLDNMGDEMINPATGEKTKFAYSGDPISETGWLDTERDARNLISAGPFELPAGEKTRFTAAIFLESGATFESMITSLRRKGSQIILNSHLIDQ